MKGLELQLAAQKVARDFLEKNASLDSSITKIAQSSGLNDEQIKRLVEESNKMTFMMGFEKNGSQTFDVATFEKVKEEMNPKLEKKANLSVNKLQYTDSVHKSRLGNYQPSMEKVASVKEKYTPEQQVLIEALVKVAADHNALQKEFITLENKTRESYGLAHKGDELIKTAEAHKDVRSNELVRLNSQIEKTAKMYEYLLEKTAGLDKAILHGAGAVGAGVLGLGVLAAKSTPTMVKLIPGKGALKKTFTVMNADMVKGSVERHAEHEGTFSHKYSGPLVNSIEKTSGIMATGLQNTLDIISGGATGMGGFLGGIIGAATKKLGGGIALTMNDREFNRSFDTIMKRNPDMQERKGQMREYFDVLTRHSPTIAKDPLVAENMVKNFDAFGGIDFSTVKAMHEMENKISLTKKDSLSPFSSIGKLI